MTGLTQHVSAMTEVFQMMLADLVGNWPADKRERALNTVAKFTLVNKGLEKVIAKGNPFTQQELDTLRAYVNQAQQGQVFTPQQATQFRDLSERASHEYSGEDWVTELLKIALIVFAVYAIAQLLRSD
jgi:hypothetical protein